MLASGSRALPLLLLGAFLVGGCRTREEVPSSIVIDRPDYARVFDAAVKAVGELGMTTAVRDREGGLIETEPRRAGTLLEPWRTDNSGFSQAAENTIATQRRRVRFEFTSTQFVPPDPSVEGRLRGPDIDSVLGRASSPLTEPGAPIELRVWVYVEQSFTPNIRRFLWTRQLTTQAFEVKAAPDPLEGVEPESLWTPVGRDEPYERRVMGLVLARLPGLEVDDAATRSSDRSSGTPHPPPG